MQIGRTHTKLCHEVLPLVVQLTPRLRQPLASASRVQLRSIEGVTPTLGLVVDAPEISIDGAQGMRMPPEPHELRMSMITARPPLEHTSSEKRFAPHGNQPA
jgi:hypothetical protein